MIGERDQIRVGGLLGTKIVPPTVPGGFLRRPRLEELLEIGVSGSVTVVSAGAGSGKTLTVASWAGSRQPPVGTADRPPVSWLALDRDDNEPSLFWNGVVAALRTAGALPEGNPINGLALDQGLTVASMQTLRMGVIALPPGVVLVLDDFHVIDHPEILESVAALLRYESPLRLVLISRTDPVLPLHRLRVNGGLQEIRSMDLAFDHREADQLLRISGNALPSGALTRLIERTEGWVTGLRLAAMFLSRGSADPIAEFAGDNRAVTEYLLAEVFASQSPRMRDFLLRTCITDQICGELADLLTAGERGALHLEELEQANAFITSLGPRRLWFRYHPLLREALLHQLRLESPVLCRELHQLAARWFSRNAAPIQALRHAAEARDWVLLGELFVTTAGPRLMSADRQAINEVLAIIPAEELHHTAALQTCAAARLEYASRYSEMPAVVGRAQRMLATDSTPYRSATAALIGLWVTAIARPSGDMPLLLQTCQVVLDGLDNMEEPAPAAEQYRTVALANQGIGLIWTGQADAVRPVLRSALASAAAADMEYTSLGCLGHLALAGVILGTLDDAQQWAAQGVELADKRGWSSLPNAAPSYLAMALVHVLRAQPTQAEQFLRRGALASREALPTIALQITQALVDISLDRPQSALRDIRLAGQKVKQLKDRPDFVLSWLTIIDAEVRLANGDLAPVTTTTPEQLEPITGHWAHRQQVRLARAAMMAGSLAQADRIMTSIVTDSSHPLAEVEVWLTRALIADRLRQDERSRDAIQRAVRLAAPERLCLPFLTFDRARSARLLGRLILRGESEQAFLAELDRLSFPAGHPEMEPEPLAEALTDREMGVLRLLPSMLSNSEIADELFISVNTVKVHLKTLYRKLDAANRRAAVRRGIALRLIT